MICPACATALAGDDRSYACGDCGARYPIADGIASFVPPDTGADGYNSRFFGLLRDDRWSDARHFWFRARNEIIASVYDRHRAAGPRPRFLEIGCGTGVVLEHLARRGVRVEGLDAFPEALRVCRARTGARVWLADARRLPFDREFDAVGLFDCLEHIADDVHVLKQTRRALQPGGILLVTVPAEPRLWSALDAAMGHVRRYTADELRSKLCSAGLEVLKLSHYALLTLPLYWLRRWYLGAWGARYRGRSGGVDEALRVPPQPLNELLYHLMRSERWSLSRGSLPYGASLIAVARRGETEP